MRIFITKAIIALILIFTIVTIVLIRFGGYVSLFYEKFTGEKATSMILGDSRGLQGIQPQVLDSVFRDTGVAIPFMNYCFTIAQTRYSPYYLESIRKKLDPNTDNGIFVLTVNPWSISNSRKNDSLDILPEKNQPPHNMVFVDCSPNHEFVLKNIDYFTFRSVFKQSSVVHKNGWIENFNIMNDQDAKDTKKSMINLYTNFSKNECFSKKRYDSLGEIIDFLKKRGSVYLVQIPVSKEIKAIEDSYMPFFNDTIDYMAKTKSVDFINFQQLSDSLIFYDGLHLDRFEGRHFTQVLGETIKGQ